MLFLRKPLNTILQVLTIMPLPFVAGMVVTHVGAMNGQTVNWVSGSPSGRCCMGMAYDGATHSTVLFGGAITSAIYGDTWIWLGGWLRLSPAMSPSARQ